LIAVSDPEDYYIDMPISKESFSIKKQQICAFSMVSQFMKIIDGKADFIVTAENTR
jgi:hypothetical protein